MKFSLLSHTFLFYHILTSCYSLKTCVEQDFPEDEVAIRCCANKKKCCNAKQTPTKFEVKAVLVKCPKHGQGSSSATEKPKSNIRENERKDKREYRHQQAKELICKRKITLTVKMYNKGLTNMKNQYIIIDHVYDEITEKKQRLLRPYVLKIKQQPVHQSYALTFDHLVNSAVREKVYNKNMRGYKGCSTDPKNHPTCKVVTYKNEMIPYSTGFCCSCDKGKNVLMEQKEAQSSPDAGECAFSKPNGSNSAGGSIQRDASRHGAKRNAPDVSAFFGNRNGMPLNYIKSNKGNKRTSQCQIRGGQDCSDCRTPPNVNRKTYHQSAHCLEFSDMWYSVYKIGTPSVKHSLTLELFEKHEEPSGNTHWKDITSATPFLVGSENSKKQFNLDATVSAAYESSPLENPVYSLNPDSQRLLIPDPDSNCPEVKGGPDMYLVLEKSKISRDGKKCDVAGVGYEAFVKQPNRCEVPRNSCLKNQPKDMFDGDLDSMQRGKKGCYFLKFLGIPTPDSVEQHGDDPLNKSLALHFLDLHTSVLNIEFQADDNVIVRPDLLAMLTETYVEATSGKGATLTVKVTNAGLMSGVFYVGLSQCPLELPAYFNNLVTKPALIAPQHQHVYNLEIHYELPSSAFHCTAQVINVRDEVIAFRRVKILSKDRCLCNWYCACACLNADEGLKCKLLSLEAYLAAGFQGGFPISLHVVQYTFLDDMISMMLYIILFLCLLLLLLGLIKGLLGLFVNINIGLWGLDVILDLPKPIQRYYEKKLQKRKVQYDIYGWPIHPDTKERVRNTAVATEFCLNIIFFIIFPFAVCCIIIRRICSSHSPYTGSQDHGKTHTTEYCKCK